MKNLLICTLVASFFIPLMGKTEEMSLPVIKKPIALEEGTQRELSASQIAELLPWARDSKIYLQDLLSGVKGLPSADKLDRLVEGVKEVVGESAPKNSELLMRYILNRGLVVNTILSNEMDEIAVGSIDAKIRVIISSINLAIKYYDIDMATLSKKAQASYVQFGWDYFQFLTEINKSIFDASAQYVIERTSLEWLQWDLYRDLNNTAQASKIVKINNSLKIYPTKKMSDGQSIIYIRQMKSLIAQLEEQVKQEKVQEKAKAQAQAQAIEDAKKIELEKGNVIAELKSNITTATGLSFTASSSVHGVCKAMGYEKGVEGSMKRDLPEDHRANLKMNENGVAERADINVGKVGSIICLKKLTEPTARYVLVKYPRIQGKRISNAGTSLYGVCVALGFHGYIEGSSYNSSTPQGESNLKIDALGEIVGAEIGDSSGFVGQIEQVVCIKNE